MAKRIDVEKELDVIVDYIRGHLVKNICSDNNVSRPAVYKILKRRNIERSRVSKRKTLFENLQRAQRTGDKETVNRHLSEYEGFNALGVLLAYETGMPVKDIVLRFGISSSTLYKIVEKNRHYWETKQ